MLNHTDRCWPRSCDTEPLGINTKVIQHLRSIKWRAGSRTDRHADKPAGRPPKLISGASGRVQDHKTKNVVPLLLFRGLAPVFVFCGCLSIQMDKAIPFAHFPRSDSTGVVTVWDGCSRGSGRMIEERNKRSVSPVHPRERVSKEE